MLNLHFYDDFKKYTRILKTKTSIINPFTVHLAMIF